MAEVVGDGSAARRWPSGADTQRCARCLVTQWFVLARQLRSGASSPMSSACSDSSATFSVAWDLASGPSRQPLKPQATTGGSSSGGRVPWRRHRRRWSCVEPARDRRATGKAFAAATRYTLHAVDRPRATWRCPGSDRRRQPDFTNVGHGSDIWQRHNTGIALLALGVVLVLSGLSGRANGAGAAGRSGPVSACSPCSQRSRWPCTQ